MLISNKETHVSHDSLRSKHQKVKIIPVDHSSSSTWVELGFAVPGAAAVIVDSEDEVT